MKCYRCKRVFGEPKPDGWVKCTKCGLSRFVGKPVKSKGKGKKTEKKKTAKKKGTKKKKKSPDSSKKE